jgi:hypothetical protein
MYGDVYILDNHHCTVPSLKTPHNQWINRRRAAVRRQSGSARRGPWKPLSHTHWLSSRVSWASHTRMRRSIWRGLERLNGFHGTRLADATDFLVAAVLGPATNRTLKVSPSARRVPWKPLSHTHWLSSRVSWASHTRMRRSIWFPWYTPCRCDRFPCSGGSWPSHQ